MENAHSNIKCSFKCNRWLSKSEEDHQIIRELPAFVQGQSPLPGKDKVVSYEKSCLVHVIKWPWLKAKAKPRCSVLRLVNFFLLSGSVYSPKWRRYHLSQPNLVPK